MLFINIYKYFNEEIRIWHETDCCHSRAAQCGQIDLF